MIPLVSLYYGGIIRFDVEQPARVGQDMFVLSKGHAVASMASIYADLGYFDASILKGSRSAESILNGHRVPSSPGVHISTGPEGHGMPVAQGFALAGRLTPPFDVYCLTGDGEMQAGMIWEAAMYAGARHLDNLCVLVDKNEGQLDNPKVLQFPMPHLGRMLESFGWRVLDIDGTQYDPVLGALEAFRNGGRDGRPRPSSAIRAKAGEDSPASWWGTRSSCRTLWPARRSASSSNGGKPALGFSFSTWPIWTMPKRAAGCSRGPLPCAWEVDERAGEVRSVAMHVLTRKAGAPDKRGPMMNPACRSSRLGRKPPRALSSHKP